LEPDKNNALHRRSRRTALGPAKFIAAEINPFVDEWEAIATAASIGGGADEVMLTVLCKMMGTLPKNA
jgi:hypothetical protein